MNNQPTAFFFEIQSIPDDTILFDQFQQQNICYSYFQVEQNYYLFVYSQKFIDIDSIDPFIHIIQELDTKQRKIRSLRGFFLYALEILERTNNSQILKTNLKPSFWRNLKSILRQNKKTVLLQFLFGRGYSYPPSSSHFEDQIQTLKNQLDSLETALRLEQQKIIQLESKLENPKYALSGTLNAPDATKIIQHGDYTLEGKKAPYLRENDPKGFHVLPKRSASGASQKTVLSEVRNPTSKGMESKPLRASVSQASKSPLTPLSESQQYNIPSNEEKGLQRTNFITSEDNKGVDVWQSPGKIPEEEQIEIIKTGFQLQVEGKLSLKKYYESTDPNSLFQSKGYSIKYGSIRRTKLYQQLKPSNN